MILTNNVELFAKSMGMMFKVKAVCKTATEANRICEMDKDASVLCETENELIVVVSNMGTPMTFKDIIKQRGTHFSFASDIKRGCENVYMIMEPTNPDDYWIVSIVNISTGMSVSFKTDDEIMEEEIIIIIKEGIK